MLEGSTRLVVAVASLLSAEASAQTRQIDSAKPVRVGVMQVDYQYAPPTVEAMASAATAIVVARYSGEHAARQTGGPAGYVFSAFELEVTEIIKTDERLERVGGHRVRVTLPGGDVEFPDHIFRAVARGTATLTPGRSYLLFLMDNPYTQALIVAWGPDGVMDVTGRTVATISDMQQRHAGKETAAFLEAVRSAVRR